MPWVWRARLLALVGGWLPQLTCGRPVVSGRCLSSLVALGGPREVPGPARSAALFSIPLSGPVYLVLSPGTFERLDGAALFEVVKPALPSLARGPVGVGGDIPREIPNELEEALKTAREIKAHAPHCRVIFTVFEMKRLGRDAAELAALADHLTEHGLVLEMLAGPLPGIYDPTGPGKLLFGFFAAMAETERENIRESTLEGLDTAARKGKYGGRPRS